MLTVSELYIYPIKSLGGIALQTATLTDRGFEHDRRWMLIDTEYKFLSQRELPQMALLQPAFTDSGLIIRHKQLDWPPLHIPYPPSTTASPEVPSGEVIMPRSPALTGLPDPPGLSTHGDLSTQPGLSAYRGLSKPPGLPVPEVFSVTIWDDSCPAIHVSPEADRWFSDILNVPCKLVYMPDESRRLVEEPYRRSDELTSFSDGYPLLIIGQSSLDDLNSRLQTPLPMDRFRPNIVFTGGAPYQEDEMTQFDIAGISFFGVKPCARCVITSTDQLTAAKGKEPLRTLSTYRLRNKKIFFGQNLLFTGNGSIAVGDSLILPNN